MKPVTFQFARRVFHGKRERAVKGKIHARIAGGIGDTWLCQREFGASCWMEGTKGFSVSRRENCRGCVSRAANLLLANRTASRDWLENVLRG